jgi:hypothetical protein
MLKAGKMQQGPFCRKGLRRNSAALKLARSGSATGAYLLGKALGALTIRWGRRPPSTPAGPVPLPENFGLYRSPPPHVSTAAHTARTR